MSNPEFLMGKEIAPMLGVSTVRFNQMVSDGRFPRPCKQGRRPDNKWNGTVNLWRADRVDRLVDAMGGNRAAPTFNPFAELNALIRQERAKRAENCLQAIADSVSE